MGGNLKLLAYMFQNQHNTLNKYKFSLQTSKVVLSIEDLDNRTVNIKFIFNDLV